MTHTEIGLIVVAVLGLASLVLLAVRVQAVAEDGSSQAILVGCLGREIDKLRHDLDTFKRAADAVSPEARTQRRE